MKISQRTSKIPLAMGVMLLIALAACTQKSFSLQDKSKAPNQAIALDPNTKANDRPTESGTGVPGYLVDCSTINLADDNVQVGCNVTDAAGVRIITAADAWNKYDIRLPADAPYGVSITKTIASVQATWDVNFLFKGADKTTLSTVARNSIYGYTYQNAAGQNVRVETAQLPPATPVQTPAPSSTAATTCLGGAIYEGICFVPVELSCSEYCGKAGLVTHPYVLSRFGAGADVDEDQNKQACHDLYVKIRGKDDFRFGDVNSERGWGCFEESNGRVVYDKQDTNFSEFPRIGDKRICGCQ